MRWGYHADQTHPTRALKRRVHQISTYILQVERNSLTIYISTSSDYSIPSFPFNPVFLYTHIYIFDPIFFFVILSFTYHWFNDEANTVELHY